MKRIRLHRFVPVMLIAMLSAVVFGCAGSKPSTQTQPAAQPAQQPAASTGQKAAEPAKPTGKKIVIAIPGESLTYVPGRIAEVKGFFKEEGLNVEVLSMSPSASMPALLSGEVDYVGLFGSTVKAAMQDRPVKVIFTVWDKMVQYLYVRPEIKTIADLKGKSIGIDSVGSTLHTTLAYILKQRGLDPEKDVTFVGLGDDPVSLKSMESNVVQAGVFGAHFIKNLESKGMKRLVYFPDEVKVPFAGLGVTNQKIKDSGDEITKVIKAHLKAMDFIRKNKEETKQIMVSWLKVSPEEAEHLLPALEQGLSPDGRSDPKGLEVTLQMNAQALKSQKQFKPEDVIDWSKIPK